MTDTVEAVMQNLVPLVENGQIAPDATYHDTHIWGNTLGANTVVARSGLGVTASVVERAPDSTASFRDHNEARQASVLVPAEGGRG